MVTGEELVKVLDFGLAKLMALPGGEGSAAEFLRTRTQEGAILGTAAYLSPEQAEGKVIDARSDIFSFGALLYEMVTGQRAFIHSAPAAQRRGLPEYPVLGGPPDPI